MLILPAIDLRNGNCVRLQQGDYSRETVFDADPGSVAQRFLDAGASFLHIVDLDGARAGKPVNREAISRIVERCNAAGARCQLGGGIRNDEAVDAALELGVTRVIVGTQAVKEPEWFAATAARLPDRIVLGLDAKNGEVAVEGWEAGSKLSALELVDQTAGLPLSAIVYTDIAKDGMMAGPNFDATAAVAARAKAPVVASGGVTTEEDVLELARRGIPACIVGRSLYEGRIDLKRLLGRLSS